MTRDDMHTCHAECQRPICVAVREAIAAVPAVAVTQRVWQGLTDEEKRKFLGGDAYGATMHDINAIEAKLKEKNT